MFPTKQMERRVTRAIKREDSIVFDVAWSAGQQFANVKHMQWFRDAVAKELANN